MKRLGELLHQQGITQYRLAKEIKAPISTVNSWFRGKAKMPRDNYLEKIAAFLHVHPAWLRYGDSQHAPTIEAQTRMLAEEIAAYGPEAVQKARKMLKIWFEGDKSEKRYPIQSKKKRRKTA